ncbi:MAG: DUF5615 family PIN-like protein [Dehalococcoidia bacterium]|nr:DUF5615 family PIN-like protein [Dehalococcoidia bacterium]
MRLFTDHDVYGSTIALLRSQRHEVQTAQEAGLSNAPDQELLRHALGTGRVLLTRDSDYGSLIFLNAHPSMGIILLRITRITVPHVHQELLSLLAEHTESELHSLFIVVEPGRHRIRRLS